MASYAPPPQSHERRTSPGTAVNLSSNNPFRRAISPGEMTQRVPATDNRLRPVNTNPFLDDYKPETALITRQRTRSPQKSFATPQERPSRQIGTDGDSAQLMNGLNLIDKSKPERNMQYRVPVPNKVDPFAVPRHLRTSQDDQGRNGNQPQQPIVRKELNIFATPEKAESRRPRRNSESSVVSAEDKKRRERKQREREARGKDGRPQNHRSGKSERKVVRGLDIIDKLDVTGVYGPGLFHHDGPFDACNPHRNRRGGDQAPMHAFPEGSANNSMGGSGPVNKTLDLDKFHGRGVEGFSDYNGKVATSTDLYTLPYKQRPAEPTNPSAALEVVHGAESKGLGTTTFLEGAPAPRSNLPRRESEAEGMGSAPGLQRKKSLAQRIRGMSKQRPAGLGDAGRVLSPEARYEYISGGQGTPGSPSYQSRIAQSAGGFAKMQEVNPFFDDLNINERRNIRIAEDERPRIMGRTRTASSPGRGLARRLTNDSGLEAEPKSLGGGLLSRVKSIRKPRGEKRSP